MKFQQCDHDEVIQIIRSTKRGTQGRVLGLQCFQTHSLETAFYYDSSVRAPGFVLSHKGPRKSTVNRIDISNEERRSCKSSTAERSSAFEIFLSVGVTTCGNGRHKQRERSHAAAERSRRARSEKDDDSILRDVPDPPERPLVISYTSKAVNISWAPGVNSHNTPISQYVIYTRKLNYKIPDWLDPLEAHSAEKTEISQSDSQRDNNI
ncbi:hypothetical protein ALC60_11925 [Trachymyrmex zeteki]|uniref:Fibronectin type-III domain-containing protein n=1 Tax=Mycetomoellerius zeteki TaxID=64791 RepID=A0A151WLV5_9HYME|nr:hypothetical protein ALC60_11925 [Trachymyrmex zeteki]